MMFLYLFFHWSKTNIRIILTLRNFILLFVEVLNKTIRFSLRKQTKSDLMVEWTLSHDGIVLKTNSSSENSISSSFFSLKEQEKKKFVSPKTSNSYSPLKKKKYTSSELRIVILITFYDLSVLPQIVIIILVILFLKYYNLTFFCN